MDVQDVHKGKCSTMDVQDIHKAKCSTMDVQKVNKAKSSGQKRCYNLFERNVLLMVVKEDGLSSAFNY